MNYNWKKGIFSSKYEILKADRIIGSLKSDSMGMNAKAEINSKNYSFVVKGFAKPVCEILDIENKLIGRINFSSWGSKAEIDIDGNKYFWQYTALFGSKYSLSSSSGLINKYSAGFSGGAIDANIDDDLLIVAGLYTYHYFYTVTLFIVVIAMLIPSMSIFIR